MSCIICQSVESKYKCKKCLAQTCSLTCFKAHDTDAKQCDDVKSAKDKKISQEKRPIAVGQLSQRHKDAIVSNSAIKDLLSDDKLRELLLALDKCPTQTQKDQMFQEAMDNHPTFHVFVQELLEGCSVNE